MSFWSNTPTLWANPPTLSSISRGWSSMTRQDSGDSQQSQVSQESTTSSAASGSSTSTPPPARAPDADTSSQRSSVASLSFWRLPTAPPVPQRVSLPPAPPPPPHADPVFAEKVQKLEDAFMRRSQPYACSGVISLSELGNVAVYFTNTRGVPARADLPLTAIDVNSLYDAGHPARFGRHRTSKLDEGYRLARELEPPQFALSTDPILFGPVLQNLAGRMGTGRLVARPSAMCAYARGGFFKPHRDTPRGERHVGTLTLLLPSTFTGGQLVVRHFGDEMTYDWGLVDWGAVDGLPWAFQYGDCEHEILPVESGIRVTMTYDVFVEEGAMESTGTEARADMAPSPVTATFQELAADKDFLPDGGVLAIGLQHAYPFVRHEQEASQQQKQGDDKADDESDAAPEASTAECSRFSAPLKGQDAAWLAAVKAAGLKWEYVAVYDLDRGDPTENVEYFIKPDGSDPRTTAYKQRAPFSSRSFTVFQDKGGEGEDDESATERRAAQNVAKDLDVTWVTLPGAFGAPGAYAGFNEKAKDAAQYTAVGVFVHLPPASER